MPLFGRCRSAAGGELERGAHVFWLEIGQLVEDLFSGQAGGEQVEDVGHADAHASDAGASAALLWIDGDPVHQLCHDGALRCLRDRA